MPRFVKLLGQHHRLFGAIAKFMGSILLQRAGDVWRIWLALAIAAFYLFNQKLSLRQFFYRALSHFSGRNGEFLPFKSTQFRFKASCRSVIFLHRCMNRPVFGYFKRFNFTFPVANQPDSHRLNPAGAEAAAYFLPQQGTQFITYDTVKHSPGLLRIHLIIIDDTGMLKGFDHRRFGNLIEFDTTGILRRDIEQSGQMPGDRFSFTIRVSCQIHFVGLRRLLEQFFQKIVLAAHNDIFRFKTRFHVNAELALRQIAQMPHRSLDRVFVFPEIFFDGGRFGG